MCRSIRTLFNFDPPANDEEIRAAARSSCASSAASPDPRAPIGRPSRRRSTRSPMSARRLMASLTTQQPPRDRAVETERARERARRRFA